MRVRERRDADLEQLESVARRVHGSDRYPIYLPDGDFRRFLTRPSSPRAWVATQDDEIIGQVALNDTTSEPVMRAVDDLERDKPAVYIARLLVDPSSRRTGAGRALLNRALQGAVSSGCLPVLDVVDIPGQGGLGAGPCPLARTTASRHNEVMSTAGNPSGLPSGLTRVPKNRLSRALDRKPTAATATEGFATHVLGMLLVMASVFVMIAGLAMLVDGAWGGWQGRAAGVGFLLGGAAVFAGGRWLMDEFAVQRRRRPN